NANCIGWRNSGDEGYQWLSYEEVHKRARAFGSGLIKYGFEVGQDTMLGIFSKNCVEWVLSEQAASMFSMVVVPMYDSLSPSACAHICNKTEMKVIICNSEANANQILEAPEAVPTLKSIIVVNETSEQFIQKAGEKGITILRFKDVEVCRMLGGRRGGQGRGRGEPMNLGVVGNMGGRAED
ncbi:putative long-chain-fatty-acid--CoA ligase 5 isoform X1, partial [Apostichopus japonicus]